MVYMLFDNPADKQNMTFLNGYETAKIRQIEMLQLLLRLGTFQLSDIFYNTVGGVLGGLIYYGIVTVHSSTGRW